MRLIGQGSVVRREHVRRSCRLVAGAALAGVVWAMPADAAPKTHTPATATALSSLLNTKSGPAGPLELGDTIVLTAGTTYTGSFTLPEVTAGSGYITIQSSAMASLPGPGIRVKPVAPENQAQYMPKIVSSGSNVRAIKTATGAHNYRLVGLEIAKGTGESQLDGLIQIGSTNATTTVGMPYNISFDRCYIHGLVDQSQYTKTGIRLDCAAAEIINCHISNIYSLSQQAVGIGGINGSGPYVIDNNYICASGENIIFGGGTGYIPGQVSSNIVITRNHLWKDPSWSATQMTCNFFELKEGKYVLFTQNLMENNWNGQGQNGTVFNIKVANISSSPWFVTEDVTITHNVAHNAGMGVTIQGDDYNAGHAGNVQRIYLRNNLMYDIKTSNGTGHAFYSSHGPTDVIYDHNTVINNGTKYMNLDVLSEPSYGVQYINNLTNHGTYGIFGTGTGTGDPSINGYFPGCIWLKNVMVNTTNKSGLLSAYAGHTGYWSTPAWAFPLLWTDVITDSVNPGTNYANFKVKNGTVYQGAGMGPTYAGDGKDIGCDIDAVAAATAGCISGAWSGPAAYEGFIYSGSTLNTQSGGVGFSPNDWTQFGTYTNPTLGTGNLNYTDSAGNVLVVNGDMLQPGANSKSYRNLPTANQFVPQAGDVLWVSFRINHTGTGALPSNHCGFALYSSLNADTSTGDELFLGNPGYSGQNWGFNPEGGTRVVAPGTVEGGAPRNVLLLYKLVYGTTNAAISMWINPNITSENTLGTPQATGTQPGLDPVRSILFSTGGTATGYQLDELRLGRTFSSVTPH